MDINGLGSMNSMNSMSSMYTEYLNQAKENQETSKLQQNIDKDYKNATDEELMSACKEFEAYFLEQVFKEMQKTIPKSEYTDASTGNLVDYFKDNMVQQIAKDSTETNSLGLAQMLYDQMKRNYDL